MKAHEIYQQLEKDFILPDMKDEWAIFMSDIEAFICDNFKNRSMGLVCDFATEIKTVYTAVFPSETVLQKLMDNDITDALLFVHHPAIWDIRTAPNVFQQMNRDLLQQCKERRIAIYNLHVPLDHFGEYSTSITLARALKIDADRAFAPYCGALAGVFGKTMCATTNELKEIFEKAVGHSVRLHQYGDVMIKNNFVAVVAGGGLDETIEEIAQNNVNLLITGISVRNGHSEKSHVIAEKNGINILGGTHYSTEKFACIAMVHYFEKMGITASFIPDVPVMEDM